MKLIEVAFKLDEPLPEWQRDLLFNKAPLHVQTENYHAFILFRVSDEWVDPR